MTEAQALELIAAYLDSLAVWLSIYLSATFAYLVVAHSVGATLRKFQARVISAIYVVASFIAWGGMFVSQLYIEKLVNSNPSATENISVPFILNMKFWEVALGILVLSGILISLYYLHDVRRVGAKPPGRPDENNI